MRDCGGLYISVNLCGYGIEEVERLAKTESRVKQAEPMVQVGSTVLPLGERLSLARIQYLYYGHLYFEILIYLDCASRASRYGQVEPQGI